MVSEGVEHAVAPDTPVWATNWRRFAAFTIFAAVANWVSVLYLVSAAVGMPPAACEQSMTIIAWIQTDCTPYLAYWIPYVVALATPLGMKYHFGEVVRDAE